MSETVGIIVAGALATFAIRYGGYAILSRFKRLPPRVDAGLNAVPAAVLAAIIAPAIAEGGLAEVGAVLAAAAVTIAGWGGTLSFAAGSAVLIALRNLL